MVGQSVGYVMICSKYKGDLTVWDYPDLAELTFAHALTRGAAQTSAPEPAVEAPVEPATSTPQEPTEVTSQPVGATGGGTASAPQPAATVGTAWQAPGPTTEPIQAPTLASGDFPDAFADTERVRKASFNLASRFEGGYGAINTYDAGIVSYGFLQFTLAAGSLGTVLQNYTNRSQSDTANGLRGYLERVINRDSLLKNDNNFLGLLRAAANEQEMIDAQGEVGEQGYWKAVVDGYIIGRQLRFPLTWALLFDMGVNFGVNHGFVRLAEKDLGVTPRSKPSDNGMTEEQLITYVAQLRKRSHDRQAERDNLPGLKVRGDFWMDLVTAGDWYLRGDASGNVYPKGTAVNVLNP